MMLGIGIADNYYAKWYTFDVKPLPGNEFYTDNFDSSLSERCKQKNAW